MKTSITTLTQLRFHHGRLWKALTKERTMRERVFHEGHPVRAEKLAEIDDALASLEEIKDLAKTALAPEPVQAMLIDEGARVAYE